MKHVKLVSITHKDGEGDYVIRIYRTGEGFARRYDNPSAWRLIQLVKHLQPFKVSTSFFMSVWFVPAK